MLIGVPMTLHVVKEDGALMAYVHPTVIKPLTRVGSSGIVIAPTSVSKSVGMMVTAPLFGYVFQIVY